jgi:hypothetical protein
MLQSRRGFLIGTGGLLTMAFVSDARAFIRGKSCAHQVAGHGQTHGTEANKSELHFAMLRNVAAQRVCWL